MSEHHVRMTPSEQAAYSLGRNSFVRGEDETALAAFRTLLRTRDGFADVYYMMGVLQDRRGDLDAATHDLGEAVRINPTYAEALLALATVYERRGDYDRAQQYAQRAAASSASTTIGGIDATTRGKLANMQARFADACLEAGDVREAIDAYRKALDRCPEFHDIRHRLGVALREAGLAHKAVLEFQRVLRANADYLDSYIQLGLTYYTLGRPQEAVEQWAYVLERDPASEDALMYLRLVQEGRNRDGTSG
jgi:tetratricopeptide (TPR) repeat protein